MQLRGRRGPVVIEEQEGTEAAVARLDSSSILATASLGVPITAKPDSWLLAMISQASRLAPGRRGGCARSSARTCDAVFDVAFGLLAGVSEVHRTDEGT